MTGGSGEDEGGVVDTGAGIGTCTTTGTGAEETGFPAATLSFGWVSSRSRVQPLIAPRRQT